MSSEIIPDSTSAVIIPPDARSVVGYEGFYAVTPDGEVYRVAPGKRTRVGRRRKPVKNRYGYYTVCLYRNGGMKRYSVHRLVAIAFIPNLLNLPQINHKNGIRADNRVENLEWCDNAHNQRHAYAELGRKPSHQRPVLGIHLVSGVKLYMPSVCEASRFLRGKQGHISEACQGKRRTAYGYHWRYL